MRAKHSSGHTSLRSKDNGVSLLEHVEGHCSFFDLKFGPSIHANDSFERRSDHEQFLLPPKASAILILEGDVDAAINGTPVCLSARNGPSGYLWIHQKPIRLDRWTRAGQRIRKVHISLPYAQFLELSSDQVNRLNELSYPDQDGIRLIEWRPNAQSLRFAEEILAAERDLSATRKLSTAIAALGLLRQAVLLSDVFDSHTRQAFSNVRDAKRAKPVRDYIVEHVEDPLSVELLAQQTNTSPSTLQRIFKNAYGVTVMEFVRTRRLEIARMHLLEEGATVSEAAYGAGYSSTANFSTAFLREFGYPPSTCSKRVSH